MCSGVVFLFFGQIINSAGFLLLAESEQMFSIAYFLFPFSLNLSSDFSDHAFHDRTTDAKKIKREKSIVIFDILYIPNPTKKKKR